MKLAELLQPWIKRILPDCEVLGLANDSRRVKPGMAFLAYPGASTDGRLYSQQAKEAGAVVVIYEPFQCPSTFVFFKDIPCIPMPSLAMQLASIAARFYGFPSREMSVIGVTGTNGKTTVAYQLAEAYALLNQHAAYIGTLGHGPVDALQPLLNTTPDALSLQDFLATYRQAGVHPVCMEVSSHALSQGRVDEIEFSQAIYTNLSHDHLDYHGTMANYATAKARLFATPSLQWAIINQDDPHASLMINKSPNSCQIVRYGLQKEADVRATKWQTTLLGSQVEVHSPWGNHAFHIQLLGEFNVYNSLAVFSSLLASGIPVTKVLSLMGQLRGAPGRMEVVLNHPCVIVDYAHTPAALENTLSTLSLLKKKRLSVVFGCGGDRDKTKRPMMGRIASQYADLVIITSDNPRTENPLTIIDEIAAGVVPNTSLTIKVDRTEAIQTAINMADKDDIVLIAGKGHETYQQIGETRIPFSDQAVAKTIVGF